MHEGFVSKSVFNTIKSIPESINYNTYEEIDVRKDKNFDDFKMPLSEELINIFKEQKDLTGYQTWVFLGTNHRTSINVESPNKALKIMCFDDELNGRKILIFQHRNNAKM